MLPKTKTQPFTDLILPAPQFFTSPTLPLEIEIDLPKCQSQELAKTHAEKLTLRKKITLPEKTNLAKKPNPNLPKLLLKILKPILKP